jgi:hypothetical protein
MAGLQTLGCPLSATSGHSHNLKLRYFTGNRSVSEVLNVQSDAPVGRSTL